MRIKAPLVAVIVASIGTTPALALNQQPNNAYSPPSCPGTTLQVCGFFFSALSGPPGTSFTFNLPNRYVVTSIPVQCFTDGMTSLYRVTDNSAMSCVLRTCKPTTVQVCDNEIALRAETAVGDTATEPVPANLLANNALPLAPSVSARCELDNGITRYAFDPNTVSCNVFACKPARLNACGSSVSISQPADLGASFQAETENHKPVTIQCLGTEARAPRYIVFEQNCN